MSLFFFFGTGEGGGGGRAGGKGTGKGAYPSLITGSSSKKNLTVFRNYKQTNKNVKMNKCYNAWEIKFGLFDNLVGKE